MAAAKPRFVVRYRSFRALDFEYNSYLKHGGMIVQAAQKDRPEPNTDIVIQIDSAAGKTFELPGRSAQDLGEKGFMVAFESAATGAKIAIGQHIAEPAYVRGSKDEDQNIEPTRPTVTRDTSGPAPAAPSPAPTPTPPPAEEPPTQISQRRRGGSTGSGASVRPSSRRPVPGGSSTPSVADRGARPDGGTTIRKPNPGEEFVVYVVKFTTVTSYAEIIPDFDAHGIVSVDVEDDASVNDPCQLRLTLPGHHVFQFAAVVEQVGDGKLTIRIEKDTELHRKAIVHADSVSSRSRMTREADLPAEPMKTLRIKEVAPTEEEEKMPIRRRLARMGMDEKINLALSGDREMRMALAMDSNKAIHHYLLKNAKISLDEIAFMARLPSLNPDVLERIAENPAYTQNPTVTKGLVYNPRTPVQTAIRLLDRLPRPELMNLAKRMNMNMRLVMAAKKKIERGRL